MFKATDKDARQPQSDIGCFDPGGAVEQHTQDDLCLESRDRGADAEMPACGV
jgi:hypothetical protein